MPTPDDHSAELVVDCRLRAATDLLTHTWDPLVLAALRDGPHRRHALRAAIGGIRDKTLTEALHRLHANGLIDRHPRASAPPRVDYGLTELGRTFVDGPLRSLGTWITRYGDALLDAQERMLTGSSTPAFTPADEPAVTIGRPQPGRQRTLRRS